VPIADARTETVRRFYDAAPFPGYPARDSLAALYARAGRSRFAQLLDDAIPADARVVDVGCGTAQMALYLARADRRVIAADLSLPALRLGQSAARRLGLASVQFVETDLSCAGLRPASFDVVFSSGVLHHTPNPAASFGSIARLTRPGGLVIVGVYNAFARVPLRVRRAIARLSRFRIVLDSILRDRLDEPERRTAWLRDQYQHPEEHCHTVAEVKRWFERNGVTYLRTYPSTVFGDEGCDLTMPAVDDWVVEGWLAQIEWIWTLGREGGLFFSIGRRR